MKTQLIEKLLDRVLDEEVNSDSSVPFEVGNAYFIRTVTYHVVGIVKAIKGSFLVLKEASWVADSGRLSEALEKGTLSEVEYAGDAIVSMNAISDAYPWKNKVPKETK